MGCNAVGTARTRSHGNLIRVPAGNCRLPGWRVTDVVAHLIGTEAMLAGEPTPATDVSSTGAAYWGANAAFPSSPAVAGTNVIRWADVRIPAAAPPAFDPTMIESILFHVPTTIAAPGPYSFCVSNLKLLTN